MINSDFSSKSALHGHKLTDHKTRIDLRTPFEPEFDFFPVPGSATLLKITGRNHASGQRAMRFPFWQRDSGLVKTPVVLEETEDWTLDFSTAGIELGLRKSGLYAGSVTAATDYWIFALMNRRLTDPFAGIIIFPKPADSAPTVSSGGALGGSATLTSGIGGYRYALGSRVLINQPGGPYNQGTVTARSGGDLTVQLDSSYGAVSDANSALGAGNYEVTQLDLPQPIMPAADELYPGNGTEYDFCYLGMVQTDEVGGIRYARKRGEVYWLATAKTVFDTSLALPMAGSATYTLARYTSLHTSHAETEIGIERLSGTGSDVLQIGIGGTLAMAALNTSPTISASTAMRAASSLPLRVRDCTFEYEAIGTAGDNVRLIFVLRGWHENQY